MKKHANKKKNGTEPNRTHYFHYYYGSHIYSYRYSLHDDEKKQICGRALEIPTSNRTGKRETASQFNLKINLTCNKVNNNTSQIGWAGARLRMT